MPHLYLIGYETESIEYFVKKLLDNNIKVVIDVREIPLSRKKGFSKNILKEMLDKYGIKYYHFKKLGSPTFIRRRLKEDNSIDYLQFFSSYRSYVKNQRDDIEEVTHIVLKSGISALLCYEKDCELCHRSILASEILKRNQRIMVTPI